MLPVAETLVSLGVQFSFDGLGLQQRTVLLLRDLARVKFPKGLYSPSKYKPTAHNLHGHFFEYSILSSK
jgi:hypothetical protein